MISLSFTLIIQIQKMTEKEPTNKQKRHQSAKNKYQHFHRVLSSKNQIKKIIHIAPTPGQFIIDKERANDLPRITSSKSSAVILTKNIKNIVQKHQSAPFCQVLNQVVMKNNITMSQSKQENKKLFQPLNESLNNQARESSKNSYFKRPISAKIYQQVEGKQIQSSIILRQAIQYEIKMKKRDEVQQKNYFQVKSRLKIPKFVHGYNTISLEDKYNYSNYKTCQDDQKIEIKLNLDKQIDSNSFLPTQYYLDELESPSQLMQKYKNQQGLVFGFSRWFHSDGSSSWKRCRIISYLDKTERWQIQWLGSGTVKAVSRNNLYFQRENLEVFQKKLKIAEQLKKKSEIFMKYNILVNLIKSPTPNLPITSLNKIKLLIKPIQNKKKGILISYSNPQEQQKLISQVKDLYSRSCHQFEFNSMLPYNLHYRKLFGGILSNEMFDPNPRMAMIKVQLQNIRCTSKETSQFYSSSLKKIKQKSFLNSQKKLKIFELINITIQQLQSTDFLKDYKKFHDKVYTIKELDVILSRNISQYFYRINCRICDIEHHLSKQLDPLYTSKKSISEETYSAAINRYYRFLLVVNMKIQSAIRQCTEKAIKKLIEYFPIVKISGNQPQSNKSTIKIKLQSSIKDEKFQICPQSNDLSNVLIKSLNLILSSLMSIKCASKSYLPQIRPGNILQIINQSREDESFPHEQKLRFNQAVNEFKGIINALQTNFQNQMNRISDFVQSVYKQNGEIHKKYQKKWSYNEIEQVIDKASLFNNEFETAIKSKAQLICGVYQANFQQVCIKLKSKISDIMKETQSILIQKIYKENEKIEKNSTALIQAMQKIPTTIEQFVQIQRFVNESVRQQIEKAQSKAKNLIERMDLLEKTYQSIQFREFQSCCQIYLIPMKLKKVREQSLSKLQNVYKKNFAQDLMKDSFSVLDKIRLCQEMFLQIMGNKTLEDMDRNFSFYNNLNNQIENLHHKMSNINQKENLLKWSKTNFDRLLDIKLEYEPYYKVITLHKNYKRNLIPLMEQCFTNINYQIISENVGSSLQSLRFLRASKFNGDPVFEPIIQFILQQYEEFSKNLPLVRSLRNPDLRERHWNIIQSVTGTIGINNKQTTLKQILKQQIKKVEQQIHKISEIATKELIYQKQLNQLKREWKDVRISIREIKIGNQIFKFINNLEQIEKKLENDILEVNKILSSSFIKFLEVQVLHWRSTILQKVNEFINYWPVFQSRIVYYLRLFHSSKLFDLFSSSAVLQKSMQKFWKQFITNMEYQSSIVQIINTRTWECISSLELQMDQIQKIISEFLEEKKKTNSKLRLFSDDALVSMIMQPYSPSTIQNMKKCFIGAKELKLMDDKQSQRVQIVSNLDEKIELKMMEKKAENGSQSFISTGEKVYNFDEILYTIDKQLKKKIKSTFFSSLHQDQTGNQLLCQVQLLRCRLIFKNKILQNMLKSVTLDGFQIQLTTEQLQYIEKLRDGCSSRQFKILSLLIVQLINQLQILEKLSKLDNPLSSFQWFKYPKYDLLEGNGNQSSKLKLIVGNYERQYQFQLVQSKSFVLNPLCDSIFLNICTALQDRMLVLLQGTYGSSRTIYLQFLGELMGRNRTQIYCSAITSSQNLIQYLKIAASGLFLIMKDFDRIRKQCISSFSQQLSIFWVNYQLCRSNTYNFKVGRQQFVLDTNNFSFFATSSLSSYWQNNNQSKQLRQCFRSFHCFKIDVKYLLKCLLLSVGLNIADNQLLKKVQCILQQLNYWKNKGFMLQLNQNRFIWNLTMQIKQILIGEKASFNFCQVFQKALFNILNLYIPRQSQFSGQIWVALEELQLFTRVKQPLFTKIQLDLESQNVEIPDLANKCEVFLKESIEFHSVVLVVGPELSGKSSLLHKVLASSNDKKIERYNFCSLNALAYTTQELFVGNSENKGIIRQLIDEIKYKTSSMEMNSKVINGLYFDCEIGDWTEPLLSIVDNCQSSQISCPDGSIVKMPKNMKMIFESVSLQRLTPKGYSNIGIIVLKEEENWKRLLENLIEKYFTKKFQGSKNELFFKELTDEVFEQVLSLYQQIQKQQSAKGTSNVRLKNPIILEHFFRYFSMLYFREDVRLIGQQCQGAKENQLKHLKDNEQKIKYEIFNVYYFSLLLTFGFIIPEESKKTFSRQIKYILQQSQVSFFGWKKGNITQRQFETIYDIYYENGQWRKYQNFSISQNISQNVVLSDKYKSLYKILNFHFEGGSSCFIIGQECSSKSYIFKVFLSDLKNERYTKNYFISSCLTKKYKICQRLANMISSEKYSRKMNGFSNCKNNIFFIQDLNMNYSFQNESASIPQFMREFYRKRSLYIDNTYYSLNNLEFYGTLNKNLPLPKRLLRYINPLIMANPQNRVQSIIHSILRPAKISSVQKEEIIKCVLNLHDVLCREFGTANKAPIFSLRDMTKVVKGISKITENFISDKIVNFHTVLRFWVYLSEKIYGPKMPQQRKNLLFYLINNVLMEEKRLRYKTIHPTTDYYLLGLSSKKDQLYNSYSLQELTKILQNEVQKYEQKYVNLSNFLKEKANCYQILRDIVHLANSFDFQSKIIILINHQKRRLNGVCKIISYLINSFYFQTQSFCINSPIVPTEQFTRQKQLNCSFTREYLKKFPNFNMSIEKFQTPFQSQFQTRQAIQNQCQISQNSIGKDRNKNKVIFHLKSMVKEEEIKVSNDNFIIQDILSFRKLRKYPRWAIPKEELYDDAFESEKSQFNIQGGLTRRNALFSKYLNTKDLQQQYAQIKQKQLLAKSIDLYFILQYQEYPSFLFQFYPNLVQQSTVVYFNNTKIEAAEFRTNKIMVTDVKLCDEQQESNEKGKQEGFDMPIRKNNILLCKAVFLHFSKYLKKIGIIRKENQTKAFEGCFLEIAQSFDRQRQSKMENKKKLEQIIEQFKDKVKKKRQELAETNKQQQFMIEQEKIIYTQLDSRFKKQEEKYKLQKKKVEEMKNKIEKKMLELSNLQVKYQAILQQSTLKYQKAKSSLYKIVCNYEQEKPEILLQLVSQKNRCFVEGLAVILGFAEFNKKEQIAIAPTLKEYENLLKQKKLSKKVERFNGVIPHKITIKVQKVINQMEHNIQKLPSENEKKSEHRVNQDISLKNALLDYFYSVIKLSKENQAAQIKELSDSINHLTKLIDKLKVEKAKKQKSKTYKQFIQYFNKLSEDISTKEQQLESKSLSFSKNKQIQGVFSQLIQMILPQALSLLKSENRGEEDEENYFKCIYKALCIRYFNQFYNLSKEQVLKILKHWVESFIGQYPDINWIANQIEKMTSSIPLALEALSNWKGRVLVHKSTFDQQKERTKSLYTERKLKKLSGQQFLKIKKIDEEQIIQYQGFAISIETKEKVNCIQEVQKILRYDIPIHKCIKVLGESTESQIQTRYVQFPIFIHSMHFSQQQKLNYPYINFSQDGIKMQYHQVFNYLQKNVFLQQNQKKNELTVSCTKQKERKRKKILNISVLLEYFQSIGKDAFLWENIKHHKEQIQRIIEPLLHQVKQQRQSEEKSTGSLMQQKDFQKLSEKQRQKIFNDQKTCQFFTRYYLVLRERIDSSQNESNRFLRLQHYERVVAKIIKQVSSNITSNLQVCSFRYMIRLQKQLKQFLEGKSIEITVLMLLCNLKITNLQNIQQYKYFLSYFFQQWRKIRNMEALNMNPGKADQNLQMRMNQAKPGKQKQKLKPKQQIERKWPNSVQAQSKKNGLLEKLHSFALLIPQLQFVIQEVQHNFPAWKEQMYKIYSKERNLSIQTMLPLLLLNENNFMSLISTLQNEIYQRAKKEKDLYEKEKTSDKIENYFAQNNSVFYSKEKIIRIAFLSSERSLSSLVDLGQNRKYELQFISPSNTSQSRKEPEKKTVKNINFEQQGQRSMKILVLFCQDQNDLQYFIDQCLFECEPLKTKNALQDDIENINVLAIKRNWKFETKYFQNCLYIDETLKTQEEQINFLLRICSSSLQNFNCIKNRQRTKQIQNLGFQSKSLLHLLFILPCQMLINLRIRHQQLQTALRRSSKIAQKLIKNSLKMGKDKKAEKQINYAYYCQLIQIFNQLVLVNVGVDRQMNQIQHWINKIKKQYEQYQINNNKLSEPKFVVSIKEFSTYRKIRQLILRYTKKQYQTKFWIQAHLPHQQLRQGNQWVKQIQKRSMDKSVIFSAKGKYGLRQLSYILLRKLMIVTKKDWENEDSNNFLLKLSGQFNRQEEGIYILGCQQRIQTANKTLLNQQQPILLSIVSGQSIGISYQGVIADLVQSRIYNVKISQKAYKNGRQNWDSQRTCIFDFC